ncbi:hypothetical protein Q3C01_18350 [Bradyrhizobium sp. UFLA05-109]
MKLTSERPFANPEAAARKLVEIATGITPVQNGRINIEKFNAPFLYTLKPTAQRSAPASTTRSIAAGSSCMRAGPMRLLSQGEDRTE